jgi:hypothetical protein
MVRELFTRLPQRVRASHQRSYAELLRNARNRLSAALIIASGSAGRPIHVTPAEE